MLTLWNILQFQLGWFALVLAAAAEKPEYGYIALAVLLSIHFYLLHLLSKNKYQELLLLIICALLGLCWETLLQFSNSLRYASSITQIAPLWIVALWVNFAATLNHSLLWLQGRYWLAAIFGAVGAPLAFIAGEKLGAVTFYNSTTALLLIACGWAVLTPTICFVAQRLSGRGAAGSTA